MFLLYIFQYILINNAMDKFNSDKFIKMMKKSSQIIQNALIHLPDSSYSQIYLVVLPILQSFNWILGCPTGFSLDSANGFCYKALDSPDYQSSAIKACADTFDGAELLVFNSDAEAIGFKTLLSKGKIIFGGFRDQNQITYIWTALKII